MKTIESNILIAEFMGSTSKQVDYTTYNEDGSIEFTANKDGSPWFVTEYSKPKGDVGKYTWAVNSPLCWEYDTWNWLMSVVEEIHSPMRVKIYGQYRDIEGEDVNVIVHRGSSTNRYITLKVEYGRRFKEFTHYKKEGETMLEPTYRFVVDFIKWYNKHK